MIVRNQPAKWLLPLAMAALALGGTSKPAEAHLEFETGTLSTHLVACDTLCTSGTLTGGLAGRLDFTLTTMNATPNPDVVILLGTITVTTATGTLSGPDVTLWNLSTGQFVDNTTFNAGTGSFAGAKGDLLIIGTFDLAAGVGASNYRAIVKAH
jgi:PPE-repeat protein